MFFWALERIRYTSINSNGENRFAQWVNPKMRSVVEWIKLQLRGSTALQELLIAR